VGDKNSISARTFAEYVASKKGKIALVSVYLDKVSETQAHTYFTKLIEKVLQTQTKRETEKTQT
jgi:type III secretory pathway component EscR